MRKPFQGVINIVRFNWHFYVLAVGLVLGILFFSKYQNEPLRIIMFLFSFLISFTTIVTLVVSYYVYDFSGFYKLNWLNEILLENKSKIVNINAGFDETSALIQERYKQSELIVLDFYNPILHTEISIKRARKLYPSYPNTIQTKTFNIQIADDSVDVIFVIFSVHEIRNETERILFLTELRRIIKPKGQIIIVEHLRDFANFAAYTIGFFHFYSKSTWCRNFKAAQLKVQKETKFTPFISNFILQKNGNSF